MLVRKRCGARFDRIDSVGAADDLSKLSVLVSIAIAFFGGVVLGAHLHTVMKEYAFLVPAGITGSAGLLYSFYRVKMLHQKFFSDAEMEVVDIGGGFCAIPEVIIEHVSAEGNPE